MKKWLAVLSAMMVLLCAVPFGAVAVSAAQTTQNVFRDGSFDTSYSYYWDYYQNTYICDDAALHGENGAYLQGNGGWGSMLEQTVAVDLGRAYHLEFWYKVVNNGFNWRLEQSDEDGLYETRWETATEWTFVSYDFVASAPWVTINFCGSGNGIAERVYIDDVVLSPMNPVAFDGYITNGDFELGNPGDWMTYQGTYIDEESAIIGNYGAHLMGYGGWGALLEQGFFTTPGVEYSVMFFYQVNQNGFNAQIKSGEAQQVLAAEWFTNTEGDIGILTFVADSDYVVINFCGGGNGIPEDAYVDNVCVVGSEEMLVDDLTDDDASCWKEYGWVARSANAAYESGMGIHAKGYGDGCAILERTMPTVAEAEYDLSFMYQNLNANAGFYLEIVDGTDGEILYQENCRDTEWTSMDTLFVAASGATTIRFASEDSGMAEQFYLDQMFWFSYAEEPVLMEEIRNGDFENNQPLGWSTYQDTLINVYDETGNRAALMLGNGGWGALLEQGFFTTPGVEYELSFQYKVLSNGFNVQIVDGGSDNVLAANWYTADDWTEETISFTASSDATRLNICGGGNGIPESAYIDDVTLTCLGEGETDDPILPDVEMVELTAGEPLTLSVTEDMPLAILAFTPEESGWYAFTSFGEYNTALILTDEEGVQGIADDNSGEDKNFRAVFYCTAGTTYMAIVAVEEGEATFDVQADVLDAQALFPDATDIAYGDTVTVSLTQAGDIQAFRFVPETDGTYILTAYGEEDTVCALYDAEGMAIVSFDDEFADEDNYNFVATYDCVAGNTYYFLVSDYAEDSSSFTVELTMGEEPPTPALVAGDTNGDGEVNVRDLGLLQQYLNEYDVDMDLIAADVTGDGDVNVRDYGLLQQYLNDYDVELKIPQ